MFKNLFFTALTFFYFSFIVYSQINTKHELFLFYNVENLFDTINDPLNKDDEFTPTGKKEWGSLRYERKIESISKVIYSVNTPKLPVVVGFAEIENKQVLVDLINSNHLSSTPYKIVHEESPDIRGIDVALIYNSKDFKYILHKSFPIPTDSEYKVRDILYVKGILKNTDDLHVFINHWKSRYGGKEKTEAERIICAKTLRSKVDSVLYQDSNAKILIMGDLNDEPNDKSIFSVLKANNTKEKKSLYNLMLPLAGSEKGTYNYKGEWNILDHIIISYGLLNSSTGYIVNSTEGSIFNPKWLCFRNKDGLYIPNRTYGGYHYFGGYSDHFPVFIELYKQ